MKCFYHTDVDAVGQCKSCGKGLCKDCFVPNNGICKDCNYQNKEEIITNEHADLLVYLEDYKKKLKSCLIWGTIFAVIIFIFALSQGTVFEDGIESFFLTIYASFSFYGIFAFTKKIRKDPNRYINNLTAFVAATSYNDVVSSLGLGYLLAKLFGFIYKVMFGSFLGFFCFFYLIFKLKKTNKNIASVEKNYLNEIKQIQP